MIRAFVAVPLEDPALDRLGAALLATGADVKATKPGQVHLTVAFLGEAPEAGVPAMVEAIDAACAGTPPIAFQLHGVGAFPNAHAPRVVWAGARPCPPLDALAKRVRDRLDEAGFPSDPKPFRAHATLGRVRSSRGKDALGAFLAARRDEPLPLKMLSRVVLFRSDPGPSYHALHEARLEA